MKRPGRTGLRLIAILTGLVLGWYAAGLAFPPGVIAAEEAGHGPAPVEAPHHDAAHADAADAQSAEQGQAHAATHDEAHRGAHDARHADDPAVTAAGELVPTDAHGRAAAPSWYRGVVGGVVALFAAAIVLGIPTLKLKTPPAPDPAQAHHH